MNDTPMQETARFIRLWPLRYDYYAPFQLRLGRHGWRLFWEINRGGLVTRKPFPLLTSTPHPLTNQWQVLISVNRDWQVMERGWKTFEFGIINFHHLPQEGHKYAAEHYRGFRIRFAFWLPVDFAR